MVNASSTRHSAGIVSSSVHVVITALLGMIVTALSCFAFYVFRASISKEQSFTDAMKVIRAATEIVASMAERGLPTIRGRVDELETRGRMLEQHQRKTGSTVEKIMTSIAVPGGVAAPSPSPQPEVAATSEAAMIAARRAARAVALPNAS